MMLRVALNRLPIATQARCLSTQGESALRKFQEVMQEYRLQNYRQETHRRFRREIVAAAKGSDNQIVLESMQRVLHNIGASEKMSTNELQVLFREIGDSGAIPSDRMVNLI